MPNLDTVKFHELIELYLSRGIEKQVPEYTHLVINEANYAYFSHLGKVDAMNYTTAVFLINEAVRALYVIYEPDDQNNKRQRYLVKTLDPAVDVGDFVIVPSTVAHKLTVAKVVDTEAEVDFDSTTNVHWVIQRVDMTQFNETVELERDAIDKMKKADLGKRRRNLLRDMTDADREGLLALPLAKRRDA